MDRRTGHSLDRLGRRRNRTGPDGNRSRPHIKQHIMGRPIDRMSGAALPCVPWRKCTTKSNTMPQPPAPDTFLAQMTPRQTEIYRLLLSHGRLTIADAAARLQVSEETIRRDLRGMAASGVVRKLHGSVMLPQDVREPPLQRRMGDNVDGKRRLAALAAQQIDDGDSLMLDTGSTTIFLARELAARNDLMVVTNSTDVARTLCRNERNQVFLCGGLVRADDGAVFGASAIAYVRQFAARNTIISIGGIDAEMGLMDFHVCEAEFSQALMQQADRVIVVADHTKFHRRAFIKVCGFDRIDVLVTDQPPPDEVGLKLAEHGVTVLVAGPEQA